MKDKIIATISSKSEKIYPNGTIHLDSVMQSTKDFCFILSVVGSGTESIGINTQDVSFLVDIVLTCNKSNRSLINESALRYGTFFNTIIIDEQVLFPKTYLSDEADGVRYIRFILGFPQCIEWGER